MWAPIPDQNNPNIDLIDGVEAHLNNSNIDHDNGPRTQNNGIYMYVSIYVSFILHLSQPDSRDPCTPWNAPCMPVYWRVHVRDLQLHYWSYSCDWLTFSLCCEDYRRRQVGERAGTWYQRTQPAETVEL